MSWVKPFRVLQDFILGYQQVNQAIENERVLRAEYDVEHHVPEGANGSARAAPLPTGRHVYDNIPKAVVSVDVTTMAAFGATYGTVDVTSSVSPYVRVVDRLGVGQYLVETAFLPDAADAPWAEVGVKSTGTGVVRTAVVSWRASSAGFLVVLLEQPSAGAAFEPTDFSFSLFIYSR